MSITVSTLVKYLKDKLDTDIRLHNVEVTGELSNFHRQSSGHLYFTLKDEKSSIECVMFSSYASKISFEPVSGDKVDIKGSISVFEAYGKLQLYVNSMKKAGIGDLFQQYEILKEKLSKEGYFENDNKKELLINYPENVCVLVGEKSAAMSDIKTCFKKRWPLCKVTYYPVLVQGKDAPKDIIKTLKEVDKLNYDYIILARGGGSFEDLFCFNDEELVKTIYKLKTFIITGIGHEQDFTLADFVSDLRAPTPTATVELTAPNILDIKNDLSEINDVLTNTMSNLIDSIKMQLDYYNSNIVNYYSKLELISNSIDNYNDTLKRIIDTYIDLLRNKIESNYNLLNAYSIDNTLKRGFSLVYKNSKLINSSKEIKINDDINIHMYDGEIVATVKE